MARSKKYEEDLAEQLKDSTEAAAYLSAALEDADPSVFLLALRDVAEARGEGLSNLARKAKLNRENLYRILSDRGNPEYTSLSTLLDALGLRLAVETKRKTA